eukprot:352467-Chlamydomonas_euryale.AAC.4
MHLADRNWGLPQDCLPHCPEARFRAVMRHHPLVNEEHMKLVPLGRRVVRQQAAEHGRHRTPSHNEHAPYTAPARLNAATSADACTATRTAPTSSSYHATPDEGGGMLWRPPACVANTLVSIQVRVAGSAPRPCMAHRARIHFSARAWSGSARPPRQGRLSVLPAAWTA